MSDRSPAPPRLWTNSRLHGSMLPGAEATNRDIMDAFVGLGEEDFTRRTHFFGGRFENLYLDRERIPGIAAVLDYAQACAREVLGWGGPEQLRCGFWLNAQGPGQSTSEHNHDELDELLSGVYYVMVPPRSGDLVLLDGHFQVRVIPVAGMLLLFPPDLVHRVETNRSAQERLSIAFNFGPPAAVEGEAS